MTEQPDASVVRVLADGGWTLKPTSEWTAIFKALHRLSLLEVEMARHRVHIPDGWIRAVDLPHDRYRVTRTDDGWTIWTSSDSSYG